MHDRNTADADETADAAGAGPANRPGLDRRRLIAGAAGVLLPAAPLLLLPGESDAGRNRRRRRNQRTPCGRAAAPAGTALADIAATEPRPRSALPARPPQSAGVNSVLIKLINHSGYDWDVECTAPPGRSGKSSLANGGESGWNPGLRRLDFNTSIGCVFEFSAACGRKHAYHLYVENPYFGRPDATLNNWLNGEQIRDESFSEGQVSVTNYHGFEFIVHRWSDGQETFDGKTSTFKRFILRVRQP